MYGLYGFCSKFWSPCCKVTDQIILYIKMSFRTVEGKGKKYCQKQAYQPLFDDFTLKFIYFSLKINFSFRKPTLCQKKIINIFRSLGTLRRNCRMLRILWTGDSTEQLLQLRIRAFAAHAGALARYVFVVLQEIWAQSYIEANGTIRFSWRIDMAGYSLVGGGLY